MPIRSGDKAPYAPTATILSIIASFRERGLSTPFTADVLIRAGIGDSLVPRTLRSLANLDLIDEKGNPTEALEALRRATTDDYPAKLAEIVRATYAEVFQFTNPAEDDRDRVEDAFRSYNPAGQRKRMVILFLGLCEAAGIIEPSSEPKKASRNSNNRTTTRRGSTREKASAAPQAPTTRIEASGVPQPILGLLAALPKRGAGWTQGKRDQFVKTFEAVLDLVVPVVTEEELEPEQEVGDE